MSIQALCGLPGHGKSYSAVEMFILVAAREGRPVVTNIPLSEQFAEDFAGVELWPMDLGAAKEDSAILDGIPGGALVLLDELWRIWPSGLKAKDIPEAQLAFIKEHRHKLGADGREMDIVFVTQDLGDIASAVRGMVETTIICKKLTAIGAKGTFRRDYYRGAVKGQEGPKAAFIRSDHGCKYKPEVWQYYRSHTKGESTTGAVDNTGVVSATVFNGLGFKIGLGVFAFLVVGVVSGAMRTKAGVEEMTTKTKKEQVAPVQPASPVVVAAPERVEKKESKVWRLAGTFVVPGGRPYALVTDGGITRRLDQSDQCKMETETEVVCEMDGEIVSRWTGSHPKLVDSAFAAVGR